MSKSKLDSILIPAEQGASKRLWVMLHGLGDSVEGYRWMPDTFRLPWMNYLLVNAPDEYYGGFSWFEFDDNGTPDIMRPGVERSRALLFQLLDAQRAAGYPTEETVLGGFSQGCLMSLDVAARYPHRLSPVAKQQRLLVTHGTYDPLLPLAETRAQIELLQRVGLNIQWQEFRKEHTIAGQAEIDLIRQFVTAGY
jgi:phospholipase/carboxylesterase